jgi:hypothetical protein
MKIRILFVIMIFLTVPNMVLAEQAPPDLSRYWQSLTIDERICFLNGHNDGSLKVFLEIYGMISQPLNKYESDNLEQLFTEMYVNYDAIDVTVLSNVISELYNEPANSYIEIGDVVRISRDKIQGKSVDNKLLKARERVQEYYNRLNLQEK